MTVTYLRHSMRHLQQTMKLDIENHLDTLLWRTNGSVPFGTDAVVYRAEPLHPEEREPVQGNTVIISFGDSPDDVDEQLGGGLALTSTTMFVDCIGTSDAVALALAEDVKDWLNGRVGSRYRQLLEFTSSSVGTPVDGWQLELRDVVRERPLSNAFRYWHVVKSTVELRFPGEDT